MLREFFPNTERAAKIYGGFLNHQNCFCRVFDIKDSPENSLNEINEFLESNGYPTVAIDEFDKEHRYEDGPVTISPHGYQPQFVLHIDRDVVAKPQLHFLTNELIKFRDERDWDQFHNPKDLAMALSIEANELLEQYLWKSPEDAKLAKVKEELADVFSFALLLAAKYNFDIEEILLEKIKQNEEKYPVEKAKGTAKKYNEL